MQFLTLLMIVVVTTFDFLTDGDQWGRWAILPDRTPLAAELLTAVVLVLVTVAGTRNRFQFVRPAYWLVFGALVLLFAAGIVLNSVEPGPIVAGVRSYLRAMPWFFLPAVFAYSDQQLVAQLRLLLLIAAVQIPLAIQQRIATSWGATGDWTSGTLVTSGVLSIFLICCSCIALAFVIRKRIKPVVFAPLFFLLLLPTMINETKATLLLLPIGLVTAFLIASKSEHRARGALALTGLFVVFVLVFVPVYDKMNEQREYATPLKEFFTNPERLERYLSKDQELGTTTEAGRVESVLVPLNSLSSDPARLAFGYGLGNASKSSLGRDFSGHYSRLFEPFLGTAFTRIMLELGALGVLLVLALMLLVFRDSCFVARRVEGLAGTIAAGWAAVTIVMAVSIVYTDVIGFASLSYLFWYFSGLVAAARMRRVVVKSQGP